MLSELTDHSGASQTYAITRYRRRARYDWAELTDADSLVAWELERDWLLQDTRNADAAREARDTRYVPRRGQPSLHTGSTRAASHTGSHSRIEPLTADARTRLRAAVSMRVSERAAVLDAWEAAHGSPWDERQLAIERKALALNAQHVRTRGQYQGTVQRQPTPHTVPTFGRNRVPRTHASAFAACTFTGIAARAGAPGIARAFTYTIEQTFHGTSPLVRVTTADGVTRYVPALHYMRLAWDARDARRAAQRAATVAMIPEAARFASIHPDAPAA